MAKYAKKPVVVEAITFEEFVEYAKSTTPFPHWSIPYNGVTFTHENDTHYMVATKIGVLDFTPGCMLLTIEHGNISIWDKEKFDQYFYKL